LLVAGPAYHFSTTETSLVVRQSGPSTSLSAKETFSYGLAKLDWDEKKTKILLLKRDQWGLS
jgi:hypothetical protein